MSGHSALLRLMQDLKALKLDCPEGVSANPINDQNLFAWKGCVFGPPETAWEGGIFNLRLDFTKEYPQKPPKVRFTSPIFHPNVYKDGGLCLDIIQDRWSPVYTVGTILMSIQSLLTDPNPASPANPEAASLYESDKKEYRKRVRKMVQKSLEGT